MLTLLDRGWWHKYRRSSWSMNWPQPSTSSNQNGAESRYLRSGTSAHPARLIATVCAPTIKYLPLTWRHRRCSIPSINKSTDRHILSRQPTDSIAQKLSSCIVIEAQAYWTYYNRLGILRTFKSAILLIHYSLLGSPNVPSTVLLRAPSMRHGLNDPFKASRIPSTFTGSVQ